MARTSDTVGFSVAPRDRPRLEHLSVRYGGGNRSEFLRRALDVMEDLELKELVEGLNETRRYGAERLEAAGLTLEDLPRIVDEALASPDPVALTQAKLVVGQLAARREAPLDIDEDADPEFLEVYRQALSEV